MEDSNLHNERRGDRATRKFSARLNPKYHEALSRLALIEGRTKTEVIKRALDLYASRAP